MPTPEQLPNPYLVEPAEPKQRAVKVVQAPPQRRERRPPLVEHGLLLIDKHSGCTSHDIVQQARKALHQKKIGHCGTLDPEATGLLVLTLGNATRLTRFLIRAPKVYEGVVQFGSATNTYDAAGEVTSTASTVGLTHERIVAAMRRFVGTYEQTPPPYCARKVGGVRFYELARRGEEIPETTKEVTVYELSPLGELADDRLTVRLSCSSGTYARSIAHELGRTLGCGAHLAALRRTTIGNFEVDNALTMAALRERLATVGAPPPVAEPTSESGATEPAVGGGQVGHVGGAGGDVPSLLRPAFLSFDEIPLPFPTANVDATQERRLLHGQTALLRELAADEGDWVKLVNRRGRFLAVGSVTERVGATVAVVGPKIVFV